jgi:galactose mutarotase-like enzyme
LAIIPPLPGRYRAGPKGRAPARLRAGRAATGAPRQQGRRADPAAGEPTPVRAANCAGSALFEADALIWDDLHSRALAYGAYGGAWLDIAFPDTPQLGLWQVPGARYICIEPWAGHADPEGFAGEISDKPGIILLPPGEARSFRMDVALRPL